jgi:hypothetical protein
VVVLLELDAVVVEKDVATEENRHVRIDENSFGVE